MVSLVAIFKQRAEGSEELNEGHILEKSIPGRRNSKYEDAEAGACAWCVTEILFYCNVPGIQQARGKVVEDEIREVGKSRSGKNFALCCE